MAATEKLWMLVLHHDFPANGPLVLGRIIANLSEPGDSLNEEAIVDIPQSSVHTLHKYDYRTTIESTNNGGAGVEYLRGAKYAPVYMIKISRDGAQVTKRSSTGRSGQGKFGLIANVVGFSIAVDDADVTLNQSGLEETSFRESSDFVIGYRLGKISFYEDEYGNRKPRLTSYTAGAMWSADDEDDEAGSSVEITVGVQFDGDDAVAEEVC